MKRYVSMFHPRYAKTLVYMLQSTEYQVRPYLQWFRRTTDFGRVMYRRNLTRTKAALLLWLAVSVGMVLQVLLAGWLVWMGFSTPGMVWLAIIGGAALVTYPVVWAYLVTVPLTLGRWLLVAPRHKKLIAASAKVFAAHPGTIIAIAGSYGKTSMKEILGTVLAKGKVTAVTPANKNVAISHAAFARALTGKEEVVIIEYGEGEPGDVGRFSAVTHPKLGIITGLAPAHLDQYPSLQAAGEDIFSLAQAVGADNTFVNGESEAAKAFMQPSFHTYDITQALGWQISGVQVQITGTSFRMQRGDERMELHSQLVGTHHVGPLAFAAALADRLGLTHEQITEGIAETAPFEHRMQPYQLAGAWVIDDTYNGNIDGLKAGLRLLAQLPGKRKIYVTPGLVDQGAETERVHRELGEAIAAAQPHKVVLMHNSVTEFVRQGMQAKGFKGELTVEDRPLEFYTNLAHFVAAGDVVLMQNDWTDNYN